MRMGVTLGEYSRYVRLCKALYDLKYTTIPIIEIAYTSGYETQESFTRAFKELFKITPRDYRNNEHSIVIQNNVVKVYIHLTEYIRRRISSAAFELQTTSDVCTPHWWSA